MSLGSAQREILFTIKPHVCVGTSFQIKYIDLVGRPSSSKEPLRPNSTIGNPNHQNIYPKVTQLNLKRTRSNSSFNTEASKLLSGPILNTSPANSKAIIIDQSLRVIEPRPSSQSISSESINSKGNNQNLNKTAKSLHKIVTVGIHNDPVRTKNDLKTPELSSSNKMKVSVFALN